MKDRKTLKPAERLIVAADFKPTREDGRSEVLEQVLDLAKKLSGTGVCLKVNSALRTRGLKLIEQIHNYGLEVFADFKLYDIPETLTIDGALLREVKPELLTVACVSGVTAMHALKDQLPETEVLGVTVLTSLRQEEVLEIHRYSDTRFAVSGLTSLAVRAGIGGVICSPKEVKMTRLVLEDHMTINTPGIRPSWAIVAGDDQNPERIMTPSKAIRAGADRIVVGRPITKAPDPYDAVMRTIEEIASAAGLGD